MRRWLIRLLMHRDEALIMVGTDNVNIQRRDGSEAIHGNTFDSREVMRKWR